MKKKLIQNILLFLFLMSCTPVPTATPTLPIGVPVSKTPTRNDPPAPTPTIRTFKAKVLQPSYCYNGPSKNYMIATIVPADTVVDVLGKKGNGEDWFMVESPSIDRCWMNTNVLEHNIDLSRAIKLIATSILQDSTCYIGPGNEYPVQTLIPRGWIIVINGYNNLKPNWVLVTPHDSTTQCWVAVTSFLVTEIDYSVIPIVQIPIFTPTVVAPDYTNPIELSWKIVSYDCNNDGRVMGILLDLYVSGELSPSLYEYSTELPVYIEPNNPSVAITVYSSGGQNSGISSTFQNIVDYFELTCDKPGNNPPPPPPPTSTPKPPPTSTPKPPPTPIPPTPTLCWPPGHCK